MNYKLIFCLVAGAVFCLIQSTGAIAANPIADIQKQTEVTAYADCKQAPAGAVVVAEQYFLATQMTESMIASLTKQMDTNPQQKEYLEPKVNTFKTEVARKKKIKARLSELDVADYCECRFNRNMAFLNGNSVNMGNLNSETKANVLDCLEENM